MPQQQPDADSSTPSWWANSVGYQVYVRSFADSDGDGIGDLPGIIDRLEHLAWLGVDVVWLTPFFPSPMADFGYDVADYTDVNPLFGSLADMDRLIVRAHELGLRVVADLVPNHSSADHRWFQASKADRTNPYRGYYIWRDPAPDGGPPNNWLSHFGGPAWTLDPTTGQYYLHLFLPEQPDLNWRSEAVHTEFEAILRFWFERGLDGFRIDVAHALYKDAEFRDNPLLRPLEGLTNARDRFESLDHCYDLLQPESHHIFRQWRKVAAEYGAILIGETYVGTPRQLAELVPGDGLDIGFWFGTMKLRWEAAHIRETIREVAELVGHRTGWVTSSHDDSRPATRFGGGDLGRDRSLGLTTLLFGLPGMPFLYQGQELGLEDAVLRPDQLTDPVEVRNPGTPGRDGCRTPMPWDRSENAGFSTAAKTWLPVWHSPEESAQAQREAETSHLHLVRRLLDVRRQLGTLDSTVEWMGADEASIVAYRRGDVLFALNAGDDCALVPTGAGDPTLVVLYSSRSFVDPASTPGPVTLQPGEAVIARLGDPAGGR